MEFALGAASGMSAIACTHPIDLIKTRLQLQMELGKGGVVYKGIISSLVLVGREEGIRGLYRGLTPALCLQCVVTGARFGTYYSAKRVLGLDQSGTKKSTQRVHAEKFLLAMACGAVGAFLGSPFYMIKTQFQSNRVPPPRQASPLILSPSTQPTLLSTMKQIAQERGISAFWTGFPAFLVRTVVYSAVQLSTYDTIKPMLLATGLQDDVYTHLAASVVTAGVAVGCMNPFDCVAARVMSQNPAAPVYSGPIDCAMKTVQNEGFRGLFKGGAANYARMGPYTILVFLFFEQYKRILT